MKNIRNAIVVLACLAALVALIVWFRRPGVPEPSSASPIAQASRPAEPLFARTEQKGGPEQTAPGPAPIIDEIKLEKSEVCEGEENLVSVKTHTSDKTDEYLHVVFLGQGSGPSFPVRTMFDRHGDPLVPEIRVFGKDGVVTEAKIPPFKLKHCPPHRALSLSVQKVINTHSAYRLYGQVLELERQKGVQTKPFQAARYEWDFGDGATLTTSAPYAEHDFNKTDPDAQYTSFVVALTGFDAQGEKLAGRTTLELENDAFSALKVKNTVQIFSTMQPRYAVLEGGVVHQHFHVFHRHRANVQLTHLQLSWLGENKTETLSPATLLGVDAIPAGKDIEFDVELNLAEHPKCYGLNVNIEGFSEDGHPASGLFSLMKPGENPTRERHVAVTDENMKARILRARQLLHQEFVSEEELMNLEQQGKFDDLKPTEVAKEDHELPHEFKTREAGR